MNQPGALCLLADYGVLRFSGADAVKFLQGQLSNDVTTLGGGTPTGSTPTGSTPTAGTSTGGAPTHGTLLRAGLHNPQGRTLALLALAAAEQGDILALLPLELVSTVAERLRRYLLRSKVAITDISSELRVLGLPTLTAAATIPGARVGYGLAHDTRALLLQSALDAAPPVRDDAGLKPGPPRPAGMGVPCGRSRGREVPRYQSSVDATSSRP